MGFKSISLEKYIKLHLKSYHSMKENEVRQALKKAMHLIKNYRQLNAF